MKIGELKFDERGLVPAVVQEEDTGEVLMLGFMNADALHATQEMGWLRVGQEPERCSGQRETHPATACGSFGSTTAAAQLPANQSAPGGRFRCHTGNRTCVFRELEFS
jgi:hypothetical protein